jgi:hypothetical protein
MKKIIEIQSSGLLKVILLKWNINDINNDSLPDSQEQKLTCFTPDYATISRK